MSTVHIITDSGAQLDPGWVRQHPVTVVPYRLQIGSETYRDGVDLSAEETFYLMAGQTAPPVIYPPTETDFLHAYHRAVQSADAVISIHVSRAILPSWDHGRAAIQKLSSSRSVVSIDSRSMCAAQGMMVKYAVQLAESELIPDHIGFDEYVRRVRGAAERIYSLYFVEDVHYLTHHRYIPVSHGVIAALSHLKPLIALENGEISVIEKMKTRSSALDHMADYVMEFDDIEELIILQPKTSLTENSVALIERIHEEQPHLTIQTSQYSPVLAAFIGTDATGCALIVNESENMTDEEN